MSFDFQSMDPPEHPHVRSLLERALGQMLIEHFSGTEQMIKELAAIHAVKIMEQILDALDDESLDDFQCIDRITNILSDYGLYTNRHDW